MPPTALLFGHERSLIREAALNGLTRLGYQVDIQIPSCFSRADAVRTADAVVVVGIRGRAGDAARYYSEREQPIPVAMLDLAHLRSGAGPQQLRVTPPKHDWLPTFEGGDLAPHDRLDALGIEIGERRRVKGQHILLIGQLSGDSAHDKSRGEFIEWASGARDRLRALTDSAIVWRPHPMEVYPLDGVDDMSDPREESLPEALEKTWLVVTYNSTAGLEALIEGLPVVAEGPCVYQHLTGSIAEWAKIKAPDADDLRELLAKLAYTQWSHAEIAEGLPLQVALGTASLKAAPAKAARAKKAAEPEPVAEPETILPEPTPEPAEPETSAPAEPAAEEPVAEEPEPPPETPEPPKPVKRGGRPRKPKG